MESFAHGKLPSDPLYDLPSWLEHNYPQYDASPKSPFYSWTLWARDNLPREQQRTLMAFHEYMQVCCVCLTGGCGELNVKLWEEYSFVCLLD